MSIFKSEKYLKEVRKNSCTICKSSEDIQAHHYLGRGFGGGKRDDRRVVPLCANCHSEIHSRGQTELQTRFFEKISKNYEYKIDWING